MTGTAERLRRNEQVRRAAAIPPPPPRSTRHNRYAMPMVALARRMYGNGNAWTPGQIHRYFTERFDPPIPTRATIRRWVEPGVAEEHSRQESGRKRDRRRPVADPPSFDLNKRMLELRRHGLPYGAIAVVVRLYHGVTLSEEGVRSRLRALGVAPARGGSRRRRVALAADLEKVA